MTALSAIGTFICLSCLLIIVLVFVLVFLFRSRLTFQYWRNSHQPTDVIDAEYTLADTEDAETITIEPEDVI